MSSHLRLRLCTTLLLLFAALPAMAREPYFSLSSDRSYMPGEKPVVNVYSSGVETLEFRVYRVNDPLQFFQKLDDVHSFGHVSPKEQIEQRTWLERFHDWKHNLWVRLRDFIREQFSAQARAEIRQAQAARNKVTGEAVFAQVPLLNSRQLVARWRQAMGSQLLSENLPVPLDALNSGVYVVEATEGTLRAYTVILVSEMAMVTKSAPGQVLAYVVDRRSGQPVPNASIVVWANRKELARMQTDAQGLAQTSVKYERPGLNEEGAWLENVWILAQHGDDPAIVAPYSFNLSSNPSEDWVGYIYTDRPVYRPGHTVHFKGIVRNHNGERYAVPAGTKVQAQITDQNGKQLFQQDLTLSPFGTVHGDFDVPQAAALGYYSITLRHEQAVMAGGFNVEEYKKPEYQVKVTPEKARVLQGDIIKATIEARYYFGEPVASGKVKYVVHTMPYWSGFAEQDEEDSGNSAGEGEEGEDESYYGGEQESEQSGTLDANGRLTITVPTKPSPNKRDLRYRIEARVMDASNREISGYNYVLATYGSFQIAVRGQSYLYRKGDTAQFTVEARDYDNNPVQTAVHVELVRHFWQRPGSRDVVLLAQDVQTAADGTARVGVPLNETGDLLVRATARTSESREVSATTYVWVPGAEESWYGGAQREIKIIPDKKSYSVGDTAKLLLLTGVPESYILVTTEARTLQTKQVIKATGPSVTVEIPIGADDQPNVYVSATFIRDNALYQSSKNLKVPAVQQVLNVAVEPSKKQFQPGEPATYNITAKDASGKAVSGEFSVGVVDEAIYAIHPDLTQSIATFFYGDTYNRVYTDSSLSFYFHGEAGKRQMQLAGKLAYRPLAQLKPSEALVQPNIRKAFPDTALWLANVTTNAQGQAQAKLEFPDSLTTWRTTVRGVTLDTKVGSAVDRVIVRKNLMVRLSVPRFFRQGDEITVSALVHNYLENTKTVQVSMDLTGLEVIEGASRQITVPNRGEAQADWRVRVQNVREATLLAKALTNEESDAMELTLPVVPFGVKLADAKAGSISDNNGQAEETITFPAGTEPSSHSLDITVTPSVAGTILSALQYLTTYPYGCTEQTMSSFLPNIIVAKTLSDLHIEYKGDKTELEKKIRAGLGRLYDYQHEDGGWGWWKDDESQVFMTAYVVSGLAQSNAAGYEVKPDVLAKAKQFLQGALQKYPRMRADLRAYVVYALSQSGTRDAATLERAWQDRDKMSAQGLALLGMILVWQSDSRAGEIASSLEKLAKVDDAQAYWPSQYDYLMEFEFDDAPETTALAVKLISQVHPQSPLLPKAALWLVDHRDDGEYWYSTKQTAMVIFGLTEYLKTSHELEADFTADVLVNGKPVLTRKFTKADTMTAAAAVIHLTPDQLAAGENKLQVRKSGVGRLYYSAREEYYSTEKKLFQSNQLSLNITRDYFRLVPGTEKGSEGEKIVYHLEPLSGTLAPGDVVAVRLTVGGGEWRYLMIEDPIPAGAEFLERDDLYEIKDRPAWWGYWFSRREFHDDRAAAFQTWFNQRQTYFYLMKIVNPGKFRVSPALVEPMYQPSVLSTTDALTVEVK
ncbi:MAG: alpha-2-macroglobulin [Acidobacteriia bacterium]|nr:alpha-2-macroglobulin [Terriglobia bacterium]